MRKVDIEQGSYDWHCMRQGIVTGTLLKSAIGSPKVQETLLYKLVSERMTEPQIEDINSPAVQRGNELEPIARKAVIAATGFEFKETGMLFCDYIEGFAFSPDGIYEEGGEIIGGCELKCPGSKKHVEYIINGVHPFSCPKQFSGGTSPALMTVTMKFRYSLLKLPATSSQNWPQIKPIYARLLSA